MALRVKNETNGVLMVDSSLEYNGSIPQLIKRSSKIITMVVPIDLTGTIMELDMENFASITVSISGGGITTAWAVNHSDIPSGTVGPNLPLVCLNTGLASKVPDAIRSTNGTIIVQGNRRGRFVKITKTQNASDPTALTLLVVTLNQEPVVIDNLSVLSRPAALVKYSNPTTAIPDTTPIQMFNVIGANTFYNIFQIKLTNLGTSLAEVRIIADSAIVFRTIVLPNTSITENLDIPLITFGNKPFNISVANATNTSVFAYVSAYYSLD